MSRASAWMMVPELVKSLFRKDVPVKSKLLLLAGLVYFLSPVDLVPDLIVGFGWVDDLIIVPLLGWLSYQSLPENVQCDVVSAAAQSRGVGGRAGLYLVALFLIVVLIAVVSGIDAGLGWVPS